MAQEGVKYDPHGLFIYGDIGGGGGTHGSFNMTMNVIDKKDNVFSLGYCLSSHRDRARPGDFAPGLLSFYPQQYISMFNLMYGKVFFLSPSKDRLLLRGGISLGVANTPDNYEPSGSWLGSNYTYGDKRQFCAGIVLNPTIELPVGSKVGFSFGVYANINYVSPVLGLEATMLFGKVRNKTPRELIKRKRRREQREEEK